MPIMQVNVSLYLKIYIIFRQIAVYMNRSKDIFKKKLLIYILFLCDIGLSNTVTWRIKVSRCTQWWVLTLY